MRNIQIIPTVIAVIAQQLLSFVFYHPGVFGTVWMQSLGKNPDDLDAGLNTFVFSIFTALLLTLGLQWLFGKHSGAPIKKYFVTATLAWALIIVPSLGQHYPFMAISTTTLVIDSLHSLIAVLMTTMILLTVPKKN